ncbi:5'-methylthioadenosine/S-adenosylhomocysteine nucleosidase [bioreactor metagenome]|uniref:adenosylhomocysteine nucleosidase n=1 Tax=bioreactor metagenome TaxID=1076179 RepID=A0A644YRA6_9ZZZZ
MGKVAAAGVAQLVISEFGATHVFNTGLAGGLKKGIKVGDIVLSAETEYFDVTPASVLKNNFPAEGRYLADKQLLALAQKAVGALGLSDITHVGLVTTGDAFITESAEKQKLLSRTAGICNDMEGGAIAQICYGNGVPFLIVRIISDLADDTANDTYYDFKAKAPKLCNDVICELVADLGQEG